MTNRVSQQRERAFFDPSDDRRFPHLPQKPTEEEILSRLSADNPDCPLNQIIVSEENSGNMRTIRRSLFTALKNYNHSMRGMNLGIYASAGQGKTFIAKQVAKTTELPTVFLQAPALEDTYSIFTSMREVCEKYRTPIVQQEDGSFISPSMIIIIDEAHALNRKLMKGGLLNAMELDDGWMAVVPPGVKADAFMVDCRNVCWFICTTDRGLLFDAFDTRLTHINWHPAGEDEIGKIVKQKMDKYFTKGEIASSMPEEVARMVYQYRRAPRNAIAFARKVIQERDMTNCSWVDAVKAIAKDMGLNEYGMTMKQVKVLTAVGQRPISKNNLVTVAGCRIEELEKFVLPELMDYAGGGPFMASTSKGTMITRAGVKRLDEMKIQHKGDTVTIEYMEEKRK